MHRGDLISVHDDSLRISELELAPIGITHESICWARWLPDRRLEALKKQHYSHLIVSPFEIGSWPALFNIRLILEDRPGSLTSVLGVLVKANLNILSIEGTPAGHRHAAINIIGEAVNLKSLPEIVDYPQSIQDGERTFLSDTTLDYVHDSFAPIMLRYAAHLKSALYDGHDQEQFLRSSYDFRPKRVQQQRRGTLFDPERLPSDVRALGSHSVPDAVKCEWMQNHAFFWLYGTAEPRQRLMQFDANHQCLRPNSDWLLEFTNKVRTLHPPFNAIANINFHEQYLRVAFSDHDRLGNTYVLKTPYSAAYQNRESTKGLLHSVVGKLSEGHVSLRSIQMSTQAKSAYQERGSFTFLVNVLRPPGKSTDLVPFLSEQATAGFEEATELLRNQGCILQRLPSSIERFASRTLFLSTSFNWLFKQRTGLVDGIARIAMAEGFVLVVAHDRYIPPSLSHLWQAKATITENVLSLIRSCDAFIQVIPSSVLAESREQQDKLIWLLFESGAAHAIPKPCEVCLDTSGGLKIADWNERLKTEAGRVVNTFSGQSSDQEILNTIAAAISKLSRQCRETSRR